MEHPDFWKSMKNQIFGNRSAEFITNIYFKNKCKVVVLGSCSELISNKGVDPCVLGVAKATLRDQLFKVVDQHNLAWYQIFYAYGDGEPETKLLNLIRQKKIKIQDLRSQKLSPDFISFDTIAEKVVKNIGDNKHGIIQMGMGEGISVPDLILGKIKYINRGDISHLDEKEKIAKIDHTWSESEVCLEKIRLKKYLENFRE